MHYKSLYTYISIYYNPSAVLVFEYHIQCLSLNREEKTHVIIGEDVLVDSQLPGWDWDFQQDPSFFAVRI